MNKLRTCGLLKDRFQNVETFTACCVKAKDYRGDTYRPYCYCVTLEQKWYRSQVSHVLKHSSDGLMVSPQGIIGLQADWWKLLESWLSAVIFPWMLHSCNVNCGNCFCVSNTEGFFLQNKQNKHTFETHLSLYCFNKLQWAENTKGH